MSMTFLFYFFQLINFAFQIFSFVPEIFTGFTSYIIHIISTCLAWILQPLQSRLLSFYLIILNILL